MKISRNHFECGWNLYKKTFDSALLHIAPTWVFEHLRKYSGNNVKMDLKPIDLTINEYAKLIDDKPKSNLSPVFIL